MPLPAFMTRHKETVVPETTASTKTESDVLMRFLTQGGATVVVTGSGHYAAEDNRWKCLGCDQGADRYSTGRYIGIARDDANRHAGKCRAMPKPGA